MGHLRASFFISTFSIKAHILVTALKLRLQASDILGNGVEGSNDTLAETFTLICFGNDYFFQVTDFAKVPNAMPFD